MKTVFIFLITIILSLNLPAQKKVKNLIIMIPDGTSSAVLSMARWYQQYPESAKTRLAVDDYLCGLVKSHSVNAIIGESAPTACWYFTGVPTLPGFVAMYPRYSNDYLEQVNKDLEYQPLITIMEAYKLKGMKTGLVFTCEFPHATPANLAAHSSSRDDYTTIAGQMVYNNVDVVMGGGVKYLKQSQQGISHLIAEGYRVILDSLPLFKTLNDNVKVWALFGEESMPYEIDRDASRYPSLAEMVSKALKILSASDSGFIMLIEGSKIDWAAHDNDTKALITEFLAFDQAVDSALCFAKKNGETAVIIMPDHATGGPTIGNKSSDTSYKNLSIHDVMEFVRQTNSSIRVLANQLTTCTQADSVEMLFKSYNPGIKLTKDQVGQIIQYQSQYLSMKKSKGDEKAAEIFTRNLADLINTHSFIGYTTHGHTGDDVFFALYDPGGNPYHGLFRSDSIHKIMCKYLNLLDDNGRTTLDQLTSQYFKKYSPDQRDSIFKITNTSIYYLDLSDHEWKLPANSNGIYSEKENFPEMGIILKISNKSGTFLVPADKNYYFFNGKRNPLKSVTVYVDKVKCFFIPDELITQIRN